MAQTQEGAIKARAAKLGMTVAQYNERTVLEKWCTDCKGWHPREEFGADASRSDGLSAHCLKSRHTGHPRGWHEKPAINPITGRPGTTPKPARDGDKLQARARVNHEVDEGRMPDPDDLTCTDCGHIHEAGGLRHSYDHYLGYSAQHQLDVQAVCNSCHGKRSVRRGELVPPSSLGLKRPGQNDNRPRRADGTFMKGGASN